MSVLKSLKCYTIWKVVEVRPFREHELLGLMNFTIGTNQYGRYVKFTFRNEPPRCIKINPHYDGFFTSISDMRLMTLKSCEGKQVLRITSK